MDHPDVRAVLPRRTTLASDRGVLCVAHATHKLKAMFFVLVQARLRCCAVPAVLGLMRRTGACCACPATCCLPSQVSCSWGTGGPARGQRRVLICPCRWPGSPWLNLHLLPTMAAALGHLAAQATRLCCDAGLDSS